MALDHESPQIPDTLQPTPDELRWEHLVDNAGFTPAEADIMISGVDPDRVPYAKPKGPRPPHRSRRGGRSYPEEYEDPQTAQPPEVLTQEERDRRQAVLEGAGHRAAQVALAEIEMDIVHKRADGNVTLELALARARAEKRARGVR